MPNVYIHSTLSGNQYYTEWDRQEHRLPRKIKTVTIAGGANMRPKESIPGQFIETPSGVMTIVSEEDYEFLKKNGDFQAHVKNGHITVTQRKVDSNEQAKKHMTARDDSAPVTPTNIHEFPEFQGMDKDLIPKPASNSKVK